MYTVHFHRAGVPDGTNSGIAVNVKPYAYYVEALGDDSANRIKTFARTKDGESELADHIYDTVGPDADVYLCDGEESWGLAGYLAERIKGYVGTYIKVDVRGLAFMTEDFIKPFRGHHLKLWLPKENSAGWAHSATRIGDTVMVLLFEYKWGVPTPNRIRDGSGGPGDVVRFYAYSTDADARYYVRVDEDAYLPTAQVWD